MRGRPGSRRRAAGVTTTSLPPPQTFLNLTVYSCSASSTEQSGRLADTVYNQNSSISEAQRRMDQDRRSDGKAETLRTGSFSYTAQCIVLTESWSIPTLNLFCPAHHWARPVQFRDPERVSICQPNLWLPQISSCLLLLVSSDYIVYIQTLNYPE